MTTLNIASRSALCLVLLASLALSAHAQNQPADKPSEAPPKLEKLEEVDSGATIRKDDGKKITESRQANNDRETTVKTGKTSYVVRPNKPAGSSLPGDTQSSPNRAAQFKIMEFDLGAKKKPKDADAAASKPNSSSDKTSDTDSNKK